MTQTERLLFLRLRSSRTCPRQEVGCFGRERLVGAGGVPHNSADSSSAWLQLNPFANACSFARLAARAARSAARSSSPVRSSAAACLGKFAFQWFMTSCTKGLDGFRGGRTCRFL